MNVGKMIFYDNVTGNKIVDTGEWSNINIKKTVDQQIATYKELSERNRDTFDVLELPYGAYSQDFRECNGYRVNMETGELEFSYPDPNEPDVEQPYQAPLSEQVKTLEATILEMTEYTAMQDERLANQEQAILELTTLIAGGNA